MADAAKLLTFQNMFNERVRLRNHPLSSYHFSSIFLWQDFFDFEFKLIDGYLCVFAKHVFGTFLYLPPLGPTFSPQIIEKCFLLLNTLNPKKSFSRIENVSEEDLKYFDPQRYKITEKSKEYCYLKKDIAGLRGNAYKSKRSSLNQFVKNHPHEWIPFDRKWSKDCTCLYDAWAQDRARRSKDDIYKTMLEENRGVHQLIFKYHDEIGLRGRLVMVDQKPCAYTFGYPLNDETFCVLVEIADLALKGLSVYIFSRFCADEPLKKFKYINVMDDFAMDNVAKTKKSFRPKILYPSYVVSERE